MKLGRSALLATVCAALGCSAAAAQAPADVTYADRVRALALDERCSLFSDDVLSALEAGAMLARNALLRGGWSDTAVARLTWSAAGQAESLSCDGADTVGVVGQVEAGYDGWRRLPGMTFPGDQRTWTATRRADGEGWLLVQNVAGVEDGPAQFGLARNADGAVLPALALPQALRPRAARLLARDPTLAPTRVEAEFVRLVAQADPHPLAGSIAPDVFTRAIWASERTVAEDDSPYEADFPDGAALLWFPESMIEDLASLDPREVVAIDLDLAPRGDGDQQLRLYVEIGDFGPAATFVRLQPAPGYLPGSP